MKVNAYAKINLTLDVTGKREDGFHLLDTVMQTVSLCDQVEIKLCEKPGIALFCSESYLPVNEKNTACKAAQSFFSACGIEDRGAEIKITKHIPSRAGMGGGSADAAAVLLALNALCGTNLPLERLEALGAGIGADVPFCVRGGACRCRGVGEQMEEVPSLPPCFLAVCKPPVGVSTPKAYAMLDRYPFSRRLYTPGMVKALESGNLRMIGKGLANRFEETMKLMQVREIKKRMLSAGALGASMTGSGSAVFGIFSSEKQARACMSLLEGRGELFLARPVTKEEFHSGKDQCVDRL